jgi:CTP synthase (UTP-ammonia lyase)
MALEHAGGAVGVDIGAAWVPTVELAEQCETRLSAYDAVWIAPGSPYRSMTGAVEAIRYCREAGVPLLGTCGGCQHVAIEFARNVLGLVDAEHAEYDPYASRLIVTPLSCSLKGLAMEVVIDPDTRVAGIYGGSRVIEEYYCNFGLSTRADCTRRDCGLSGGIPAGRRGS